MPVFKHIYTNSNVTKAFLDILVKIVSLETPEDKAKRIKTLSNDLADLLSTDNKLIVYRGVYKNAFSTTNTSSLPIKKAISFTTCFDTAKFFACRWVPTLSTVYTLQIPVDKIIFYTNGRNEKEIIILPDKAIANYITDKTVIKQEQITKAEYIERYSAWLS
ncbi:MAG: hypothetical protein VB078_09030 [Clostridiaceae bacterium]|nr:hypothetical protein [Clostridiaceae bacterium]